MTYKRRLVILKCTRCHKDLEPTVNSGNVRYCPTCRVIAASESKRKHMDRVRVKCDRTKAQPYSVWMWDYLCHDRPDLSVATRRRNLQYLAEFGV